MKDIQCRQCGFVNSKFAEICQKCNVSLRNTLNYLIAPVTENSLKKISLFQIFKNDYFSFLSVCFPFVFWIIFIGVLIFGFPARDGKDLTTDESQNLKIIIFGTLTSITLLTAVFLYKRVNSIRRIFATGEFVIGVINFVDFDKDRGRVEYSYSYNQQTLQSGTAIMKNSRTKDFQTGDELSLIVDKKNPKRALIPDLYVQ